MALYHLEDNKDGSTLAIWEQPNPVSRKEKRENERNMEQNLLDTLFGPGRVLDHHPNGQPYIQNFPVNISISHTNRFAVILTHPNKRVGVDVELLDRDFGSVEKRALSAKESANLLQEKKSLQLAIIWSAKEAIYKLLSMEGVDFSQQIEIEKFNPKRQGVVRALFLDKIGKKTEFIVKYQTIDNHILTSIVKDF